MKYISTFYAPINRYSDNSDIFIYVLPYTKLLNISMMNDSLLLLFKGDINCTNASSINGTIKKFIIKVIRGNHLDNIPIDDNFEFHSVIKTINYDFIEYYNIFYFEDKTIDELRDDKINEIIEE